MIATSTDIFRRLPMNSSLRMAGDDAETVIAGQVQGGTTTNDFWSSRSASRSRRGESIHALEVIGARGA
jgi:hypothetical protein